MTTAWEHTAPPRTSPLVRWLVAGLAITLLVLGREDPADYRQPATPTIGTTPWQCPPPVDAACLDQHTAPQP